MNYKIQGKKNKAAGGRFELKVRKDLEKQGWIVAKWTNNVEFYNDECVHDLPFIKGKIIPAKRKYNPFNKALSIGTGFPDFIALTTVNSSAVWPIQNDDGTFHLSGIRCWIGVEVKSNGYLKPEEKEKCKWLLINNIFSKILVAKKGQKRGDIEYQEFK